MDRREFLRAAGAVGVAPALASEAGAQESNPTGVDGTEPYRPKVRTLRYPLAGVPTIEEAGDVLRVELDGDAGIDPATVEAHLEPSFGVTAEIPLRRVDSESDATSRVWNADEHEDDNVVVATFRLPDLNGQPDVYSEGLYDLYVAWDGGSTDESALNVRAGSDHQPRAVQVYETIPDEPQVVVVADPQIGDPRAVRTGGEEARHDRSPEPFVDHLTKLTGDRPGDRWEATRRAFREVNALDPDIVVVAGDLTFGQDVPGKYYAEYEDAWTILNTLRAPSFCTLGNHDGYVQGGVDGKALYRETFGPPSYAVDVGNLHLVAVDTYDWTYLDRFGASFAVSSYGGQVRDAQFEWLREDLRSYREQNPEGTVLAFGHHNPSWQPDPENRVREQTDGRPGAEQVGRGLRYPESGQLWTGENQFALRDLFDEVGVAAFCSGHSHRDRLARTIVDGEGPSDIAETHGPRSAPAALHYVAYELAGNPDGDGEYSEYDWTVDPSDRADTVETVLRDPSAGTLYVGCTTTMSGTGEYWGWRPFTLDTSATGLDPGDFGYPATQSFLEERAVNPANWNPDHSSVGLYSHPSYRLSVSRPTETDGEAVIEVQNDLATPVEGAVYQTLSDCPAVLVTGGDLVWRRRTGDRQEVKVAVEVPAESTRTVRLVCRGSGFGGTP